MLILISILTLFGLPKKTLRLVGITRGIIDPLKVYLPLRSTYKRTCLTAYKTRIHEKICQSNGLAWQRFPLFSNLSKKFVNKKSHAKLKEGMSWDQISEIS